MVFNILILAVAPLKKSETRPRDVLSPSKSMGSLEALLIVAIYPQHSEFTADKCSQYDNPSVAP